MDAMGNELSTEVLAREKHQSAISNYSLSEHYGYKFIMDIKDIRDDRYYRDLGYTNFDDYCKQEWELEKTYVQERIKIATEFGEESGGHDHQYGHRKTLLLARMPKSARNEVLEKGIPTENGNKTIQEATRKEIETYQKQLKEKEEYEKLLEDENNKLSQQLQQERNKPQQVKTEVVEKIVEVDKTDYTKLQQLQNQLDTLQRKNSLADREINLLKSKLQDEQDDADAYRKAKAELEKLYQTKDDLSRQIESATSISGLVVEIENLLQGKLAPVKYSKAIYEQQDSPVVIENLREIIERVMDWCNEMNDLIPKESGHRRVIIDGQVVESELI